VKWELLLIEIPILAFAFWELYALSRDKKKPDHHGNDGGAAK
jgi:hypothetical protein